MTAPYIDPRRPRFDRWGRPYPTDDQPDFRQPDNGFRWPPDAFGPEDRGGDIDLNDPNLPRTVPPMMGMRGIGMMAADQTMAPSAEPVARGTPEALDGQYGVVRGAGMPQMETQTPAMPADEAEAMRRWYEQNRPGGAMRRPVPLR